MAWYFHGRLAHVAGQTVFGHAAHPVFELLDAVRVGQAADLPGLVLQLLLPAVVVLDDPFHEAPVDPDPAVADQLVDGPEPLLGFSRAEGPELVEDRLLRHDVLQVVLDEEPPLLGVVPWHVPRPAAVGRGGLAGLAEVVDERLASAELLLILRQAEGLADGFQGSRQAEGGGQDSGAAPAIRVAVDAVVAGEGRALEVCIEGGADHCRIGQEAQELVLVSRELEGGRRDQLQLFLGSVRGCEDPRTFPEAPRHEALRRCSVQTVGDQDDLEVRRRRVGVCVGAVLDVCL